MGTKLATWVFAERRKHHRCALFRDDSGGYSIYREVTDVEGRVHWDLDQPIEPVIAAGILGAVAVEGAAPPAMVDGQPDQTAEPAPPWDDHPPFTLANGQELPYSRVVDLLVTAWEGGINYWARESSSAPYSGDDLRLPVDIYLAEDESDDAPVTLTMEKLNRGLYLLTLREHIKHLADIIEGNDDATTADVFVQLCLFGELRYC